MNEKYFPRSKNMNITEIPKLMLTKSKNHHKTYVSNSSNIKRRHKKSKTVISYIEWLFLLAFFHHK